MQLRFYLLISLLLAGIITLSIFSLKPAVPYHKPTFEVNKEMEYKKPRGLRSIWLEELHKCAPGTDWRVIESETTQRKYKTDIYTSDTERVRIGDGMIIGSWEEKGSINQSGSIIKVEYNKRNRELFLIADGGSLWKGGVGGLSWEPIEQTLRFDTRFLSIAYPNPNQYRLVSAINGFPHYKDASSDTWNKSMFFELNSKRLLYKDQYSSVDGKYIIYLAQEATGRNTYLILSSDYGASFQKVETFVNRSLNMISLDLDTDTHQAYIIKQNSSSQADLLKYDLANKVLTELFTNSRIELESSGSANIKISKISSRLHFYVYDKNNNLYRTRNNGSVWQFMSQLGQRPWEVGLYVSKVNPNIMMYGAEEAFRSTNGGTSWSVVNEWTDYYTDKSTKLHADIMYITEFEHEGSNALIVSNHGGLSISYNNGASYLNLALKDLNVGQYYSTNTYPLNQDYIFAGSQDQGMQRGLDFNEGPINLEQFFSGDFGYLQFTNFGKSLWSVYPGGWITYYPRPLTEFIEGSFQLDSNLVKNWLPPIIKSPFNPQSIILAGGFNDNDIPGSYLYSLTANDLGDISSKRLSQNFGQGDGEQEISAIGSSQIISNDLYVATSDGRFFYSTDVGNSFTRERSGLSDYNYFHCNKILSSKRNSNKILIAGSGYDNPGVFESNNKGRDFNPIHQGLPPTTIFDLEFSPNEDFVFAATEAGPYAYSFDKQEWYNLSNGAIPNQRFWSVEYVATKDIMRWGTYGRGIWDFKIENLSNQNDQDSEAQNWIAYPNPVENRLKLSKLNTGGRLSVYNSQSQLIMQQSANSDNMQLDFSDFSNGVYYLIFESENKLSTKIIVKQ